MKLLKYITGKKSNWISTCEIHTLNILLFYLPGFLWVRWEMGFSIHKHKNMGKKFNFNIIIAKKNKVAHKLCFLTYIYLICFRLTKIYDYLRTIYQKNWYRKWLFLIVTNTFKTTTINKQNTPYIYDFCQMPRESFSLRPTQGTDSFLTKRNCVQRESVFLFFFTPECLCFILTT